MGELGGGIGGGGGKAGREGHGAVDLVGTNPKP